MRAGTQSSLREQHSLPQNSEQRPHPVSLSPQLPAELMKELTFPLSGRGGPMSKAPEWNHTRGLPQPTAPSGCTLVCFCKFNWSLQGRYRWQTIAWKMWKFQYLLTSVCSTDPFVIHLSGKCVGLWVTLLTCQCTCWKPDERVKNKVEWQSFFFPPYFWLHNAACIV